MRAAARCTLGAPPAVALRRVLGGALALAAVWTLPGAARAQSVEPVVVQLKWHHQAQFAGQYVAAQKGFYRQAGLVVEHRPWAVGQPSPIAQVVSGAAAFGITSHTQFLVERANGAPVVAIAAIYQRSPVAFFTLAGSGITRPGDFSGRTIAYAPTHEIHLHAMLRRLGIDATRLRRVPYSFDLTPFLEGKVAILAGYVTNQPVDVRLAGRDVHVVFPHDYGVRTYDDIVFTSEALLGRSPALVERWLRATLRGWRHALERPDEAVETTLAVDPSRRRDKERAMLLASLPLIHDGRHPIGWMSREVWEEAHRLLRQEKILKGPLELDRAYTTRVLERAHGQ